jgi:hypothetical protein
LPAEILGELDPYKKYTSAKVPRNCHSEGAKRPKNLVITCKYEILRFAQDDKKDFSQRSQVAVN